MKSSLAFLFVATSLAAAEMKDVAVPQADYTWSNVSIGGGGAITRIVLHPRISDLAYIRTDVGGAYRWDEAKQRWIPLLESLPLTDWNLYGADSLAVDPNDATGNILYLTTGKYTDGWAKPSGMLMKSIDRGLTWSRLPLSPTGGSNQDQSLGERLEVDPHNSAHHVYAARSGTFSSSLNSGATWTQTLPLSRDNSGTTTGDTSLAFVLFDATSSTVGNPPCTKILYLGASQGIYRSMDAGQTWQHLDGSPDHPRRGVVGLDGNVIVSHAKGISRYDGNRWSDITPPKPGGGGGGALAIDPADSNRILATLGEGHHTPVFLSTNKGETWADVSGRRNPTRNWWPSWHWFSHPFSLAFDPFHKNQVWATDWYGTYQTPDITTEKPVWTNRVEGIEEIVTIGALFSPTSGKYRLFSGAADIGGLDHDSLDAPPKQSIWDKGIPIGLARTGLAAEIGNPQFIVTVGTRDWSSPGNGAYSLDGGDSWKVFPSLPAKGIKGGRVAVTGRSRRILWVPQEKAPAYSDDLGTTWQPVTCAQDLSGSASGHDIFSYDQPLAVDLDDPNRVYLLHANKLFLSTDAGATFTEICADLPGDYSHKIATSGTSQDVWIAADEGGLLRSTDGGKTFARNPDVQLAKLFSFGKAPTGKTFPALFVCGIVKGHSGYFRSDDEGRSWMEIDLPLERIGDDPNTMTGDWTEFGGVFVGTNGRGIYYGRPLQPSQDQRPL